MRLQLELKLESDATFGRGEGLAGLLDEEVEFDEASGLPFVRGRTIKGLLVEECANLLYGLRDNPNLPAIEAAAQCLFGQPGSSAAAEAALRVGHGLLPKELQKAVAAGVRRGDLQPADVLESLTAIRRQTAVDEVTGAPEDSSLRSMRVVLRETTFHAQLDFAANPDDDMLALLAACVLCVRRGGMGRNRGRGQITARLLTEQGAPATQAHFSHFKEIVRRPQP